MQRIIDAIASKWIDECGKPFPQIGDTIDFWWGWGINGSYRRLEEPIPLRGVVEGYQFERLHGRDAVHLQMRVEGLKSLYCVWTESMSKERAKVCASE
jgi:hypothetical protein